ncbi:MAG: hypothetical protein R2769_11650 [Saprospiraceae bacterium]
MEQANKTAETVRTKGYKLAEDAKKLGYEQTAKLEKEAGNNPLKKQEPNLLPINAGRNG